MLDAAAALLARAFQRDPFLAWAEPDEGRRPRLLTTIYRSLLEGAQRRGTLRLEPGVGSVDWRPPGEAEVGLREALATGAWRVALVAPPATWRRLARHEGQAMARARAFLGPGTAYLATLGVDPALQGQGHGGRLLEGALAAMRERGWAACALRTEQPTALPFYRRHGFEVVDEALIPVSGLRVWVCRKSV